MLSPVSATPMPSDCSLVTIAANASFADTFTVIVPHSTLTALQIYAAVVRHTPGWVETLMALRNKAVRMVGLKNLGRLSDVPIAADHGLVPGDRVGLFTLVSAEPEQLVMQDNDHHLIVQLSLQKMMLDNKHDKLALSTVVHTKNMLGKLYMLPVGPIHKLIVPAVLGRAPEAVLQAIHNIPPAQQ